MDPEELRSLKDQILAHKRRKNALELQYATQGIITDPSVINEIKIIDKKIEELSEKIAVLESLQSQRKPLLPQRKSIKPLILPPNIPSRQSRTTIRGILILVGIILVIIACIGIPIYRRFVYTQGLPEGPESDNLINSSDPVAIYFPGKSLSTITRPSGKVVVDFRNDHSNDQWWSGVAFRFTPALDVRGFRHLVISGTATQKFTLSIEYKVREGSELKVATDTSYQPFPATIQVSSWSIPLEYDGAVDELTLMFYVKDEASQVTIESIRLSQ